MKHLFFVHSHITDAVSQQIVRQFELNVDDCIFILDRNFSSTFKNQTRYLFQDFPVDSVIKGLMFWKQWKAIKIFDQWVENITGGLDFEFFVPHTLNFYTNVFISHPSCKGFSYIEEGKAAYIGNEKLFALHPKRTSILKEIIYRINFKRRSPALRQFYNTSHPKYKNCYCINDLAYQGFPSKIIIDSPFHAEQYQGIFEHMLVVGPYAEIGRLRLDDYLVLFERLIDWLIQQEIKKVHVKFHPVQEREGSIRAFKDLFQKKTHLIEIEEVGKEVVLENIAAGTMCKFYMIMSSAGIYAIVSGNEVYSIYNSALKMEPNLHVIKDNAPDILKDNMIYIDV